MHLEEHVRVLECAACEGTGRAPCTECNGTGEVAYDLPGGLGDGEGQTTVVSCPTCHGAGRVACPTCKRTGRVRATPVVVATRWVDAHPRVIEPDEVALPNDLAMVVSNAQTGARTLLERTGMTASELVAADVQGYRDGRGPVSPRVSETVREVVEAVGPVEDARLQRLRATVTEIPLWELHRRADAGDTALWLYGDPPQRWHEHGALPSAWRGSGRAAVRWLLWAIVGFLLLAAFMALAAAHHGR